MMTVSFIHAGRSALLFGLFCAACGDDDAVIDGFGGASMTENITTVTPPTSGADSTTTAAFTTTGDEESGGESSTSSASTTTGADLECLDGACTDTSTSLDPTTSAASTGEMSTGEASTDETGAESTGGACVQDVPDPACTGVAEGYIYVATVANGGSEFHDGRSPDKPVHTLTEAIEQAQACPGGCECGQTCSAGRCAALCPTGTSLCGCGACCARGQVCVEGMCRTP